MLCRLTEVSNALLADGAVTRRHADPSRKAYFKEFKKLIDAADVILEVLDARDPLGCRCEDIEKRILTHAAQKKIM
jgi:nuclear GTP-binding protein